MFHGFQSACVPASRKVPALRSWLVCRTHRKENDCCPGGVPMRMIWSGVLLIFFVLRPLSLYAQLDVGSITGTLRDASGAIIPGAKVTAIQEGTGLTEEVQTNASGVYVFKLLKPANYGLTVA